MPRAAALRAVWRQLRQVGLGLLLGAGCIAGAASARGGDCGWTSAGDEPRSNNRMVLPHPQATRAPDPWVDPGSAMPKGDFACGTGVRCTLAGVYKEAHVCALLVNQHGRLVHD